MHLYQPRPPALTAGQCAEALLPCRVPYCELLRCGTRGWQQKNGGMEEVHTFCGEKAGRPVPRLAQQHQPIRLRQPVAHHCLAALLHDFCFEVHANRGNQLQ